MKRHLLFTAAAVLLMFCARAQTLTAAEYFFDTDPGVGNGTALTITAGDSILFAGGIPATSLSAGFHFLYIRTKDSNGAWQISERRMFFIHSGNTTSATLTAAEYFFDTDPGVGNATSLTVTGGDSIIYSGSISAASLSNGFHFLYFRAKDANGTWGIRERRMIYIQGGNPTMPSLSAAEYFFDTDPGVGNGTALPVTTGDSILFSGAISSGALPTGFHILYIRSKDLNGSWGLAERRMYFIQNTPVAPILVAAEYFVTTDPGFGNATPITVTSGDSIVFGGPLAVTDTALGFDSLYIRVKNQAGVWSLYEAREFQITPIGIEEIQGNNCAILFQNYPNPFSSSTVIDYYLQSSADVTFYVTDLVGKVIKEVKLGKVNPGKHSVLMNYPSLEDGYYSYRIVAGDFADTKQMIHLKQ